MNLLILNPTFGPHFDINIYILFWNIKPYLTILCYISLLKNVIKIIDACKTVFMSFALMFIFVIISGRK